MLRGERWLRLPSVPGSLHKSVAETPGQPCLAEARRYRACGRCRAPEWEAGALARGPRNEDDPSIDREPFLAEVGARIRSTRKRLKLKQSDLAAAIGSGSSTYIVAVEAGEANLTLKMLLRIATALSVSPRDLLPVEYAEQVTKMLDTTLEDLDHAAAQLRQARTLVAPPAAGTKPSVSTKE